MFTSAEQKWIDTLDRLARKKPENIALYITDSNLIVCKKGVPSHNAQETIMGLCINAGAVLTDMHDDMDNGSI